MIDEELTAEKAIMFYRILQMTLQTYPGVIVIKNKEGIMEAYGISPHHTDLLNQILKMITDENPS